MIKTTEALERSDRRSIRQNYKSRLIFGCKSSKRLLPSSVVVVVVAVASATTVGSRITAAVVIVVVSTSTIIARGRRGGWHAVASGSPHRPLVAALLHTVRQLGIGDGLRGGSSGSGSEGGREELSRRAGDDIRDSVLDGLGLSKRTISRMFIGS